MMSDTLWNKIFDVTSGGLDIILQYYPNAREGKNFKSGKKERLLQV